MKIQVYAVTILALLSCAKKETYNAPSSSTLAPIASTSTAAPAEETYPMTATIVSRDSVKNMVNLDNNEVPGRMGAMKMDYELRGAKVGSLPADGTPVVVTMHDQNGKYWISDVKPASKK
jgi:hypothetical protein